MVTSGISSDFSELSRASRQITHVLRTLTPLQATNIATRCLASDLHVLSTPPAFVLSQNQTLRRKFVWFRSNDRHSNITDLLVGCRLSPAPTGLVSHRTNRISRNCNRHRATRRRNFLPLCLPEQPGIDSRRLLRCAVTVAKNDESSTGWGFPRQWFFLEKCTKGSFGPVLLGFLITKNEPTGC